MPGFFVSKRMGALVGLLLCAGCSHKSHSSAARASAKPAASSAPKSAPASRASAKAASSAARPGAAAPAWTRTARRTARGGVCHVHWSADGSKVAIVDAARIRVKRAAGGAWLHDFKAPAKVRFADYSLPHDLALERRGHGYQLVTPGSGAAHFASALAGAKTIELSEDGQRAILKPAQRAEEWFTVDLATGKRRAIKVPPISAGGSDTVPVWARRRSIQVEQSRIASGFFDYLAKPYAGGQVPILRVGNCYAQAGQGTGAFYGADTDAAFRTAVVARKPCERAPHVPMIEVWRRAARSKDFTRTKSWRIGGKLLALWLSPDGGRVIVRAKSGGKVETKVYDTRTGKARGNVALHGGCFAFSPDGKRIAEKRGSNVSISVLP